MEQRIISGTGEWTCPKCGSLARQYRCENCGFRIYAGFFIRLFCQAVDGSIVWAVTTVLSALMFRSYSFFILSNALGFIFFRFYFMFLTGLWGQTPGKMLAKIRVIRLDGYEVHWSNAILRNIFETILVLIMFVGYYMALSHTTPHDLNLMPAQGKEEFLGKLMPDFVGYCVLTRWTYALSEFFVLLFNKKKRAIHDFIAGTVIIRDPRMPFLPGKDPRRVKGEITLESGLNEESTGV